MQNIQLTFMVSCAVSTVDESMPRQQHGGEISEELTDRQAFLEYVPLDLCCVY